MPSVSRSFWAGALLSAVASGACSTQQLPPNLDDVMLVGLSSPEYDSAAGVFVIRDDAYDSSLNPRDLQPYYLKVDGRLAAWDATTLVPAGPASLVWFTLPAGSHMIALVDARGQEVVTSPSMETRPGFDPSADLLLSPAVVFFGGPTSLRARVLVEDPASVPAGSVRVRLMNALADHQPIQPVQCLTDLDSSRQYTADACAPVGAPIAYGELFERDAEPDVAAKLGYYWAAPDAVKPVVMGLSGRAATGLITTHIPTQVQGPSNPCPSCVVTEF